MAESTALPLYLRFACCLLTLMRAGLCRKSSGGKSWNRTSCRNSQHRRRDSGEELSSRLDIWMGVSQRTGLTLTIHPSLPHTNAWPLAPPNFNVPQTSLPSFPHALLTSEWWSGYARHWLSISATGNGPLPTRKGR